MLDVMIITAHRRGEYLLEKLAQKENLRFQAFDVSSLLGRRDERDLLGPFGRFEGEQFSASALSWLQKNQEFVAQPQGWTLMSDEGSLEATGTLSHFQKKHMQPWAYAVAKQLHSRVDLPLRNMEEEGLPCDFLTGFHLPWALQNSRAKLMDVPQSFRFEQRAGSFQLEFQGYKYQSTLLIHFLNDFELQHLSPQGLKVLRDEKPLLPRFTWQRADIQLEAAVSLKNMPLQVVMVPRTREPWMEENFLILQSQGQESFYSLWYRTWFEGHQSTENFRERTQRIEVVLKDRFPGAQVQWLSRPFEIEESVDLPLYPIYDLKEWQLQTKWFERGAYNGSSDKRRQFLWSEELRHQEQILEHFEKEHQGDEE